MPTLSDLDARKPILTLRRKLFAGLAILMAMIAVEAGRDLIEAWEEMSDAKRYAFIIDTSNDLALSVKDLAFERGRANAVLHAAEPVSEENRVFIHARRAAGMAVLDRAFAALGDKRKHDDVPKAISVAIDGLKRTLSDIDKHRRQVDAAIEKPFAQRDPKIVQAWLPAMTNMLDQIARTMRVLDALTDSSHIDLSAVIKLRTAALDFRLSAGRQAALLSEAVASQIELPAEKIATIDRLRGRVEVHASDIEALAIAAGDGRTQAAVLRAMNLYFGDFGKLRDHVYAAATDNGAYPVDLAGFGRLAIPALDSAIEIVEQASAAATKAAAARFASARHEFVVYAAFYAFALAIAIAIMAIIIGHIAEPIERITASLRARSASDPHSGGLPDLGIRNDEIGEMSRAIAAFERAVLEGQAALTASEERLRFLLSSSPAVICSRRPHANFDITYISSNVRQSLGFDAKDFMADPDFWRNGIHPDDVADVMAGFGNLTRHESATFDYRFSDGNGGWRWIRDTVTVVRDPDGNPSETIGAWIDVTPQMETARALLDLNARLEERVAERTASLADSLRFNRATIDALDALIAVLDENGEILATNAAWRDIAVASGARPECVNEGANYLAECRRAAGEGSDGARQIADGIEDVIAGRRHDFATEYPCHSPEGTRWFQCRVTRFQYTGPVRLVVAHEDVTPVHRALDRLATSERTFETLAEVSPVGIFRTDAEGRCQYVNARWTEITGLNQDEAAGDGWFSAVHEDDREHVLDQWSIATRAGVSFRAEYRFKDSSGKITWVIGQSRDIRNHDGTIEGYIGAITDITELKEIGAKLTESEARFRGIIEHLPIAVVVKSPDRRFVTANPAWERMYGLPEAEILGKTASDAFPGRVHNDDVDRQDMEVLESREARTRSVARILSDGMEHDLVVTKFPIFSASGEIMLIGGFVRDATEQLQAIRALKESEARFRGIIEHLPLAVVIKSRDARFVTANPAWERMYGLSEETILGKTTPDIFPKRPQNKDVERQELDIIETREIRTRSVSLTLPDGKEHDLIVTKFPIFNAAGEVALIGGFIRDVTDQLQTVRALQESEARLRGIVEYLPFALAVKSRDRRYVTVNPAWERMYGLAAEQLHGKTNSDIFPDRPQNETTDRHEEDVIKTGNVHTRSFSLVLPDGKKRDIVVTKFPIFNAAGEVSLIGGFIRDVTDQLHTIRALQGSEARLRGIIDNLPISLDVRDMKSRYVLLSRVCSEWYGIRESSAVGKTNAELFPDRPISNEISAAGDREIIETRRRNIRESERTLADGKKHLLEITKFPIFDMTGEMASIGTFVVDVTDRKLTERALRLISTTLATVSGQEFFDTLVRLISTLLNVEAVLVGEIVDDTRSRMRARAVFENHRPAEGFAYDVAGTPSAQVISSGQTVYVENVKDDFPDTPYFSDRGIESYAAVALRDVDGQPIGHLAAMSTRPFPSPELAKSILELFATSASAALQRARLETRFRDLFEYSPDGLIMTGGDGAIAQINRTAETMFGYSRDEIIGSPVEILIPDESKSRHVGLRQRYVATPLPRKMAAGRINLKARRKDGSTFPADINLSPIRVGDSISVVASIRDISDKVAVEQQLRHAQKMEAIGEMTGGLAHDFNNLLAVIITNLEMISQRAPSDAVTTRMIARAVEASERSGQLVQRLLAFSRKQSLSIETINLNTLILRVRELLVKPLGAEIEIGLAIHEDLWLCQSDAAQVESALVNLAINARDAMPDGGTLTIESDNVVLDRNSPMLGATAIPGEYVMLAVSDTGAGMAPDVLARCIEPFFTTKDIGRGSGLGLSMVFGLANQSGGYLDIVSQPGHGTTVRIYLPRAPEEEEDDSAAAHGADARSTATDPGNGRRIHVLVVEDDPDMRVSSVTAVESCGYRATAAEDGSSALAALEANPDIEILFSDVILPGGLNGVKLAEEAVRRRPDLRVLLTSGYSGDALARKESSDFSWDILKKPYRFAELRDMLMRLAEDGPAH